MPKEALASGRPLTRVLADDPQVAAWNRRRQDEAAVQKVIGTALPRPLAAHVAALLPAPDQLDLVATTGTIAAALRQRLPAVALALGREGLEFREIRVRVQPGVAPAQPPKPLPRQWDSSQKPALAGLEQALPPGPLKAALARWLSRAGR
jgi:hypothetical protein